MTALNFMWFGIGMIVGSAYATVVCTIGSEKIYRFFMGCLRLKKKKITNQS